MSNMHSNTKPQQLDLTVVLPTYNEKKNIQILIPQLEKLLTTKTTYTFEILVVDDNSPDGTAAAAKQLSKKYKNIRVLTRTQNEGLGAALIDAYNHAKGDRILSMDSDLAFSLDDVITLLHKLDEGYDLVVGSRHDKLGGYEKTNPRIYLKYAISKLGNTFTQHFLKLPVHDFSLNFRVIRKEMWKRIDVKEKLNTMLLEMIVRTRQQSGKITSIPVTFKDRIYGESKMKLHKQAPIFLKKVLEFGLHERFSK
ncbi:MAG: glycosyltransferase [Nanoarchaeota archaeon]